MWRKSLRRNKKSLPPRQPIPPASAKADITAQDITLPADKTLKVTVNGRFTATLDDAKDVSVDYTIEKDGNALTNNATVLTADSSETRKYNSTSRHAPMTAGAVL